MILAFSCKTHCLYPSCAQRRVLDFDDWVVVEVIPGIPVVSCTFTIPKMLRIYFRFDHSLYPELSRCAWETIKECFQAAFDTITLVPGMITGIHTSDHVLNFHPHVHTVTSAGCFDKDGAFIKGLQEKVGTVDSESLGYRSALVSKVRRKNGSCGFYRRPGGDKEDTHPS